MIISADNGSMFFWDWKTGYNFQRIQAAAQPGSIDSESGIFSMTFDRSGSRLLATEADKTIKIYKEDESAVSFLHFCSNTLLVELGLSINFLVFFWLSTFSINYMYIDEFYSLWRNVWKKMILMSSVTLEKKCILYETCFWIILPFLRSFNNGLHVVNFHYSMIEVTVSHCPTVA